MPRNESHDAQLRLAVFFDFENLALGFKGAGDSFDVIFADPPYAYAATPDIPGKVFGDHLLRKDGVLIVEHARTTEFQASDRYKVVAQKPSMLTPASPST